MDDLLQEFVAETRETLEALAGEIIVWETDPTDRARLDAIFRFVHTVKGSCGFLDLPRLARLSHAAEDVLAAVRDGNRSPDTRLVNAVLAIVDRIGEIVEAIDAGAALDDTGEDLLIAALDAQADVAPIATVAPSAPVPQRAPARSVRLSVDLLDRMMSGMSEMVLARNELARRLRDDDIEPAAEAALERLSLTVAEMRDTVTRTRMQPIDALFSALPRMVRDTAAGLGKQVALTLEGSDVELDREMIEMMRDPLVHIVRNSIDHGIESPAARVAAGKPALGRLCVAARQSGNTIVVEVGDDGRGVDTGRLLRKLAADDPRAERTLNERERLELIFEPGLSSRDEVTAISGRGVGMDVVRANIEQIGGRIELENRPGRGLTIVIHVPLTLSILPAIILGAGNQRFAMARQSIVEIVAPGETVRIDAVGDGRVATVRGRRMPVVDLPALLGLDAGGDAAMLAIVSISGGTLALAVDTVLDSEELVIKPAAPAVMASGFYAGQTLPDTGVPMLVLDASGIASACGIVFDRERVLEPVAEDNADVVPPVLLFVDRDGARRAVPLAAVDRVEQVNAAAITFVGGRLRLAQDGRIVPLIARGGIGDGPDVSIIRLRDGNAEIAYAVQETCGIVQISGEVAPVEAATGVTGITLIDGDPVELIDLHWLFGEVVDGIDVTARGLCVLAGDRGGWLETFLAPVLERAGYRVATSAGQETPVAVLAMVGDDLAAEGDARVVRLSDVRGSEGIYRYDRTAVLAAVAGESR